jgi:Transcriptional antiterminator
MIITRVLNNNVVEAEDSVLGEVVIMGSGIGFRARKGDIIDKKRVQKTFVTKDYKNFKDLLVEVPAEYLELTAEIVNYANANLDQPLKEEIYVLLTDHIYFALKRIAENMEIDNPFLVDVKAFYKKEYLVALYGKEMISKMFGVDIPDYEVGYIAMHIIEASYNQRKQDFKEIFEVINICIDYIKSVYVREIKEGSLSYTRLLNHVKYFAKRYIGNEVNEKNDVLLDKTIAKAFNEECRVIEQLSSKLYAIYGKHISRAESNYLVLHIRNCKELSD